MRMTNASSRDRLLLTLFAPGALAIGFCDVVTAATAASVAAVRILVTLVVAARAERELTALGLADGRSTSLVAGLDLLRRVTLLAILGVTLVLFAVAVVRGLPPDFLRVVLILLVVGAVPVELPDVARAVLAGAAARMSGRGAVVRRLGAVETLGRTTTVVAHRTGVLTDDRAVVTAVAADGLTYETTGAQSPEGSITAAGTPVSQGQNAALDECLRAGAACNDGVVMDEDGPWTVLGDPRDQALLTSAAKLGICKAPNRVSTLPFTRHRRFMATLHRQDDDEPGTIYVKGAVERVLYLCGQQLDRDGRSRRLDRAQVLATARALGRRGLDVLAFAQAQADPGLGTPAEDALPMMTFLGLQALHSPLRSDALDAVAACEKAGLQVKLITGLDATAAAAIATWTGIGDRVVTGAMLAGRVPADLPGLVCDATVFVDLRPEEEGDLVRAMRSCGHVVTVVGGGDGAAAARRLAGTGVGTGDGAGVGPRVGAMDGDEAAVVLVSGGLAALAGAIADGRAALRRLAGSLVCALVLCSVASAAVGWWFTPPF
ncbi:hypothetical protein HII36_34180 [Nonomuraea sp. NN258]|uniref:hypothetical protein n=1 Tax=Nonomuraea antri TaxID=2730852 RepID=UPI001568E0D9|nr:hypothetical protein [Nonomuraea antri]NRQ36851.1 hypothetical protein [Nonomuraea antri]